MLRGSKAPPESKQISAIVSTWRAISADGCMRASRLGWYSVSDANPAHPYCLCHHVTVGQNSYRHERLPWWQCSQSISSHWNITTMEVMLRLEYCTHLNYTPLQNQETPLSIMHCSDFCVQQPHKRQFRNESLTQGS